MNATQKLRQYPKSFTNGTDRMYVNIAISGQFVINFNSKFFSYKTYYGYWRKATELINKYNLIETNTN